jgi:hypothetical protein
MQNTFRVEDVEDGATVQMCILGRGLPQGVYEFRLFKGSPLRKLLESQESFEEAFDRAKATK